MSGLEVEDVSDEFARLHTPEARRKAAKTLSRRLRALPAAELERRLRGSLRSPAARERAAASLRARGIAKRAAVVTPEVRTSYEGGESLKSISDRTGISRVKLGKALMEAGVMLRGQSEAERGKWVHRRGDRAAVERQCSAAWEAARGREKTREELEAAARTNSARLRRRGRFEDEMAEELRRRGFAVTQQRAEGRYCIDVAVEEPRIAVEVFGTYPPPPTLQRAPKRTEALVSAGWTLVEIHAYRRDGVCRRPRNERGGFEKTRRIAAPFDARTLGEYLVAFAEVLRRDPSARGQHRMVDGQGEALPPLGLQRYHWSRV